MSEILPGPGEVIELAPSESVVPASCLATALKMFERQGSRLISIVQANATEYRVTVQHVWPGGSAPHPDEQVFAAEMRRRGV